MLRTFMFVHVTYRVVVFKNSKLQRQKNHKFKAHLDYRVGLRLTWET